MTGFIAILLTVSTFIFIAYPLFSRRAIFKDSGYNDEPVELDIKREAAHAMLKELELDYQSGILSEEDYRELEKRYSQRGVTIPKNDKLEKGTDIGDEIEKEVAEARQRQGVFCSRCGAKHQEGDRFCTRCGASLK